METHVCQWALLCHGVAVQLLLHFAVASFCSVCNASFSQQGDPALLRWLLVVGLAVFFRALWSFLLFG